MDRQPLPDRLLAAIGIDRAALADLSPYQVEALAAAHPAVTEWYRLLAGHARAAGAHLMLSKRFLFNPQRRRDEEGIGDKQLVSNRRGTTGMDESILDRLTRLRREHGLAALRHSPAASGSAPLPVEEVELRPQLISRPAGQTAQEPEPARPVVRVAAR